MNKLTEFYKSIVVLDTETTHLHAEKAEIVEIAGARYNGNEWIVESMLLGAKNGIPPEASAKNNISNRMIDGLPTFGESVEKAKQIIHWDNSDYWICHNSKYDQDVLFKAFNESGLPDDAERAKNKNNWICTFRLAKQLLDFDFSDMQYNLSFLRYKLDLPVSDELGVHRAQADTYVCKSLLEFLVDYAIKKNIIDETGDIGKQLNDICWRANKITKWPFGKHKGAAFSDIPTDYYIWSISNISKLDEKSSDYDSDLAETIRIELEKRLEEDKQYEKFITRNPAPDASVPMVPNGVSGTFMAKWRP